MKYFPVVDKSEKFGSAFKLKGPLMQSVNIILAFLPKGPLR